MSVGFLYWYDKSGDRRAARRCSVCSERVLHGIEVTRKLQAPVKRGCVGGVKCLFICDTCRARIAGLGRFGAQDQLRLPMPGCACSECWEVEG